jgi:hypothetical protein
MCARARAVTLRRVDDPNWWLNPDSAWWVKLERAREHIAALELEVNRFLDGGGYRIESEPGGPHETVYRLRLARPIPSRISAIIGDVLHNLRSALDSVGFELARQHVGRDLTKEEEKAAGFPVSATPERFVAFFQRPHRGTLYGAREQSAMRAVQPGATHDEATRLGVQTFSTRWQAVRWDRLWLLNGLSIFDRHRRLLVTVMSSDLVYWPSPSGQSHREWRYGTPPFDDGAILGYLTDDPDHPEAPTTVHQKMDLRLPDPVAGQNEVVGFLSSILRHVQWAVTSVFRSWVADMPHGDSLTPPEV